MTTEQLLKSSKCTFTFALGSSSNLNLQVLPCLTLEALPCSLKVRARDHCVPPEPACFSRYLLKVLRPSGLEQSLDSLPGTLEPIFMLSCFLSTRGLKPSPVFPLRPIQYCKRHTCVERECASVLEQE